MELTAQKRQETGKQNKGLRLEGTVPGVVFGPDMESVNVAVNNVAFKRVFRQTGETSLIDLDVEGEKYKVLVKDMQYDPLTLDYMHIGFYKPNLLEKINADIPVEIIGEEQNELIKSGEAIALALVDTIEIEALPTDLPSAFIVDVSGITEIGEGILVEQLEYDKEKVEIVGVEPDMLVAKLDYAEMLEVEEEEVSEEEALAGIEATEETADDGGEDEEEGGKESGKEEKAGSDNDSDQ